jgi:hypothetical protein
MGVLHGIDAYGWLTLSMSRLALVRVAHVCSATGSMHAWVVDGNDGLQYWVQVQVQCALGVKGLGEHDERLNLCIYYGTRQK